MLRKTSGTKAQAEALTQAVIPFTYQGKGNFLPFGFFLCEMECMVLKEKVQALFSF